MKLVGYRVPNIRMPLPLNLYWQLHRSARECKIGTLGHWHVGFCYLQNTVTFQFWTQHCRNKIATPIFITREIIIRPETKHKICVVTNELAPNDTHLLENKCF